MAKTLAAMTAKMLKGMQGAGPSFTEGVQGVTKNPAQSAIEAKDLWQRKIQEAIANGSWEKGLAKVELPAWKAKTAAAASKYVQAAPNSVASWTSFAQKAQPVWERARQSAKSMPKGTIEDAVNRVRNNLTIMSELKGVRG